MRPIAVLVALSLLSACNDQQEPAVTQQMEHTQGVAVQAGRDASVTVNNNYQKSQDWQNLLKQRDKLQERVRQYPDDASFQQELAETLQQMEDFKREVTQLAEDINKIPLNTERLKLAVQHFNAGEYDEARAILDAGEIGQEQDALLARQQELQTKQAELQCQLDDKANEFMLLAHLTAINYSLGEQRIPTTRQHFEQALKSGRTPERLFEYAKFLQENNQFQPAEKFYQEALKDYRQLAKDNPAVYLPDVAMTLNNLGILVKADSTRRAEAETLYQEALKDYRQLAKDNPAVYLHYVAGTLNNLGALVQADSTRRAEAETLYQEALKDYRQLARDNPAVYLHYVARTLNNLGNLVQADSTRRPEAETLYQEALGLPATRQGQPGGLPARCGCNAEQPGRFSHGRQHAACRSRNALPGGAQGLPATRQG